METDSQKLIINPKIKNTYGFLILTNGTLLIGTVSKGKKEINFKEYINFRAKTKRRGGCSALRFARIRKERIANTVRFIDENLKKIFVTDNQLNISGLIIGGEMDIINIYLSHENQKLQIKEYISSFIELSYGGELGFYQAIAISMIYLL